jgi:hypothetical protein
MAALKPFPQDPKMKQGLVPLLRLGAYDIPEIPALFGTPIADIEKGMEVDLDGVVGSGLLAAFRVTLTDGGRAMWLEDVPSQQRAESGPPPSRGGEGTQRAPEGPSSAPPQGAAPPPGAAPPAPPTPKPAAPKAAPPNKKAPEGPPIAQ